MAIYVSSGKEPHHGSYGYVVSLGNGDKIGAQLNVIKPGAEIKAHSHENTEEVYYVLSGAMTIISDGEDIPVKEGDFVVVPPRTPHKILAKSGELRFLQMNAPPFNLKSLDVVYV